MPADTSPVIPVTTEPAFDRDAYLHMELLRFTTCGSVDDGKSTLIGRLLYDTKTLFEDQLEAVERTSVARGDERVNLALITDGLRSEREQGITIDVAYRYFATPRRKFIIADTPGHVQYTRNMVTGASTAHLAIVLIDARKGVIEQTRRHTFIALLMRTPHVVVAVNKMDLAGWSPERFDEIKREFETFAAPLGLSNVQFIPVSALHGDNVVDRSEHTPWYDGPALLEHLETVSLATEREGTGGRFPVQWVIRPQSDEHHDYRGYAGQVAAGIFRAGDRVVALPSGHETTVTHVDVHGGTRTEAVSPMSVALRLADDLDLGRGDMLCHTGDRPTVSQDLEAMVVWMQDAPLKPGARYTIKHTTRTARAVVKAVVYKQDVSTMALDETASQLGLNEIGRVQLKTTVPLFTDPYARCRQTGSFVLIDESTHMTAGVGMVG